MKQVMKTIALCATLLFTGNALAGGEAIEHAMKQMNKSYRAALKENDLNAFRRDIQTLKTTAESILNRSPEGYDQEIYAAGMSLLIDEVTAVESAAENEGLEAGKKAAQKLGSLMRKYHSKLGVD
ncbi:hypothetical protein FWL67_19150 [Salmonella enterica]|nr:hypothetical protein [Salmonella enterica]